MGKIIEFIVPLSEETIEECHLQCNEERLVRCKDCENFVWDSISQNAGSCGIGIGTPPNYRHSKNWFCANGKKPD